MFSNYTALVPVRDLQCSGGRRGGEEGGCNVVKNVRREGPFILSFASYVKQSVHVGAFALLSNEMFSKIIVKS